MPTRRLKSDRTTAPSFVQPFLRTLNQMREQEAMRPDEITDRAARLLLETFGPARESLEATFAHASVGVMADHTHYFDGFALLLSVPYGVAVAAREASGAAGRVVVGAVGQSMKSPVEDATTLEAIENPFARIAAETAANLIGGGLDMAVVPYAPPSMRSGSDAATAIATARAVDAVRSSAMPRNELLLGGSAAIEKATGSPFSVGYLLASSVLEEHNFILADTATLEALPIDLPTIERPGFALVDCALDSPSPGHSTPDRIARVSKALEALRSSAFPELESFRDLQHRDLEKALAATPRKLRPVVQHLVTENAKVQRLVMAVRKRDWQMFGALLIMSHASKGSEWGVTTDETEFIVRQAEQMSLEGIYGATHVGEVNDAVLVVGQPFSVPPFLEHLRAACLKKFDTEFATTLI